MMKYLGLLLIFLLMFSKSALSTDYCKMNCRGIMHTMCKYKPGPGPNCGLSYGGKLSSSEKKEILKLHNEYRMKIANGKQYGIPKAADMMEMVWDNELEAVAQRLVDQCSIEMGHDKCRSTERFPSVGQNIASITYTYFGASKIRSKPAEHVRSWYNEVNIFNTAHINSYKFDSRVGHFTQMIWAKTTHVGCAHAQWSEGNGQLQQELICNYGPSGNFLSHPMYTIGTPCSKCPKGSHCSFKYQGLCKQQY